MRLASISSAVFGLLLLAFAPSVSARELDFRTTLGLTARYDDNIFQYSENNLARFDPSNPSRPKYAGLDSTDDFIVSPSLDVRATLKGPRPTRVFAGIDLNAYRRNTIKNYQAYSVGISQRVVGKTDVILRYRLIPSFFVGRLADQPNQTAIYAPADFRLDAWRLVLDSDLTPRFGGQVFGIWEQKDYNGAFNERDTTVKGGGLAATARLHRALALKLGVEAETGDAAGADPAFAALNSDSSYREKTVSIRPTFSPSPAWDLSAGFARAWRDYTSDRGTADANYFGREDTTDTIGLGVHVELTRAMNLRAAYDRIERSSNKTGVDLEFGTYTEQRETVGVEYRF